MRLKRPEMSSTYTREHHWGWNTNADVHVQWGWPWQTKPLSFCDQKSVESMEGDVHHFWKRTPWCQMPHQQTLKDGNNGSWANVLSPATTVTILNLLKGWFLGCMHRFNSSSNCEMMQLSNEVRLHWLFQSASKPAFIVCYDPAAPGCVLRPNVK